MIVTRYMRGAVRSIGTPSQYYMFALPCQQADGDADDEQVTDYSGNEAHASINSLTTAEIWASAGYATTIAEANHYPEVPVAKWPFRFTTDSLIISMYVQGVCNGSSTLNFFGNGYDSTHTGIVGYIGTTGAVAFGVYNGSSIVNWTGTSVAPYATDTLHCVGFAYDVVARSGSYYIDGAHNVTRTNVSAANLALGDTAVTADIGIGGWAGNGNLLASKVKFVHAIRLPGRALPANTAAIMHRLYAHPRMMLSDGDLA